MEFLRSFRLRRRLAGTSSDAKFLLFPQASSSCQVLNFIHHPDLGSDTSSVWNFFVRLAGQPEVASPKCQLLSQVNDELTDELTYTN